MKKFVLVVLVYVLFFACVIISTHIEKVEADIYAAEYGAYYVGDPRFGEVRVHDESGEYLFSINGDRESAASYYWWMPSPDKGLTYDNALNENNINAVWENENIKSIVKYYGGKDIIVGCLPYHYDCGGYTEWLNQ